MTTTPKPSPDQVGAGQLPTAAARRVPLGGGEIARLAVALEAAFTLDELNNMIVTGLGSNLSLSLDAVVAVEGRFYGRHAEDVYQDDLAGDAERAISRRIWIADNDMAWSKWGM